MRHAELVSWPAGSVQCCFGTSPGTLVALGFGWGRACMQGSQRALRQLLVCCHRYRACCRRSHQLLPRALCFHAGSCSTMRSHTTRRCGLGRVCCTVCAGVLPSAAAPCTPAGTWRRLPPCCRPPPALLLGNLQPGARRAAASAAAASPAAAAALLRLPDVHAVHAVLSPPLQGGTVWNYAKLLCCSCLMRTLCSPSPRTAGRHGVELRQAAGGAVRPNRGAGHVRGRGGSALLKRIVGFVGQGSGSAVCGAFHARHWLSTHTSVRTAAPASCFSCASKRPPWAPRASCTHA